MKFISTYIPVIYRITCICMIIYESQYQDYLSSYLYINIYHVNPQKQNTKSFSSTTET